MNYMRKLNSREIGAKYELLVKNYLLDKQYEIIETNFRTKNGEIDIIAKAGEYLVFAEVKYRSKNQYGTPKEAVTLQKQRKIISTAKQYLFATQLDAFCRFDVIEVFGNESINHIVNAFEEA
ncbi:YraN family protein [Candidatus Epulonipiscium viviparus]|uniref:YraN family protein n=1 Tax=Candidatus Epulonipiscium viviparus TaxID=420336 RepID=UPI00016C0040|nr:YraN family protein [Candidatus Epulopiscium viviparus]